MLYAKLEIKKYAVVEFPDTETVEIVPCKWVHRVGQTFEIKVCYPPENLKLNVTKLCRKLADADTETWSLLKGKLLYVTGKQFFVSTFILTDTTYHH